MLVWAVRRLAAGNEPRCSRHVGVLGDELEVAVARISPHGLDYPERRLVKDPVGGVSGTARGRRAGAGRPVLATEEPGPKPYPKLVVTVQVPECSGPVACARCHDRGNVPAEIGSAVISVEHRLWRYLVFEAADCRSRMDSGKRSVRPDNKVRTAGAGDVASPAGAPEPGADEPEVLNQLHVQSDLDSAAMNRVGDRVCGGDGRAARVD